MSFYQEHALEGATAVDLVVALYDGMIRFLHAAISAVDKDDQMARRVAVKRALDIIIHLQARLRMDVGGRPAQVLSEFYASIFAQVLQASQSASREKFEHVIECVRNVRDAWKQVARETGAAEDDSRYGSLQRVDNRARIDIANAPPVGSTSSNWTA